VAETLAHAKTFDAKHRKHRLVGNFRGQGNVISNLTGFLFILKLMKRAFLDEQAIIVASVDKFIDP
jgi:mRNA-degrading endonuclease YafQ of YafQ-DinJ toxin-antitoxin module